MTLIRCPSQGDIVRFVDVDLSPERLERVSEHLAQCQRCRHEVQALRTLVEDLGAPTAIELDVAGHVRNVMSRLGRPAALPSRPRVMARLAAIVACAASLTLLVYVVRPRAESPAGTWQARGSSNGASLSRDVGVQVYTLTESLRPLRSGDVIAPNVALTAGLRNLGDAVAHVLLFAVDSRNALHWITPQYQRVDENPAATEWVKSPAEHVLATSVVFDDLAPGPLRLVTIVSPRPVRVSQVESLSESELAGASLAHRFPDAEVREVTVRVVALTKGNAP